MKTKFVAIIVLSMLLVLPLMNVCAYAEPTTASVAFEEGDLEFGDAGYDDLDNMNIDFGLHTIPVGPTTYKAADSDHTLMIMDARMPANAGKWYVTVELSEFDSQDVANTFDGTITLSNPTLTSTASAFAGFTASQPSFSITSGGGSQRVVDADDTLTTGSYYATWLQDDIELFIDAPDWETINEEAAYEATMTWTLTKGV